jgi:hypothetical protein
MSEPNDLLNWQRRTLPLLLERTCPSATVTNVTAISHHLYRDPVLFDTRFDQVKAAFLMTRLTCGTIPCVLVVNRVTQAVEQFCDAHAIKIDCDPSLPGGIPCLSLDCIQNLHARFDTEYMLCIHGDGFPLRRGLESFVGSWDYIGAPWGPASWYTNLVFPYPKYCVGNGGFSLRSKRLCEMAASCYRKKYRIIPNGYALIEDVYYCKVLPRFETACRKTIAYAPPNIAGRFSFESNPAFYPNDGQMPLGFHASCGFSRVMNDFGDQINAPFR